MQGSVETRTNLSWRKAVNDQDDWRGEQDRDEKRLQVEVERVIELAATRPLQPDEQLLLAWASGTKPTIQEEA